MMIHLYNVRVYITHITLCMYKTISEVRLVISNLWRFFDIYSYEFELWNMSTFSQYSQMTVLFCFVLFCFCMVGNERQNRRRLQSSLVRKRDPIISIWSFYCVCVSADIGMGHGTDVGGVA